MFFFTDKEKAQDKHALPNAEVFYVGVEDAEILGDMHAGIEGHGWYWWSCFPGCIPDSEAIGPFLTDAQAIEDAMGRES